MKNVTLRKILATTVATALTFGMIGAAPLTSQTASAASVKKVTLSAKKATLYKGAASAYSKVTLKATVKPSGSKVKWSSSNKKVATVTAKGVVTAKKAGKATITAKAGSKKATCKVTVKNWVKVTKVKVSKSSISVDVGSKKTISASVTPSKASIKALTYTSSNKKVATVTAKGVVKGVAAGTATVTVKAADGSKKSAKVKVTVVANSDTDTATEAPTAAPTDAATAAPATDATTAPTEAPATDATTEPTDAATTTDEPASTTEPTDEPAATEEPASTDATDATETPVTVKNDDGSYTYTINEDNSYVAQATFESKDHSVTVTDSTILMAKKMMEKLSTWAADLDAAYTDFYTNGVEKASYELAEGTTVEVTGSETNSGGDSSYNYSYRSVYMTVTSDDETLAGYYTFQIQKSGGTWEYDGQSGTWASYTVYFTDSDWENLVQFDVAQGSDDNTLEISKVSMKRNGEDYLADTLEGKTYTVAASEDSDGVLTVTVTETTTKTTASMTYKDGVLEVVLPGSFVEDYSIKVEKAE